MSDTMCLNCRMNTAGQHESHCPLAPCNYHCNVPSHMSWESDANKALDRIIALEAQLVEALERNTKLTEQLAIMDQMATDKNELVMENARLKDSVLKSRLMGLCEGTQAYSDEAFKAIGEENSTLRELVVEATPCVAEECVRCSFLREGEAEVLQKWLERAGKVGK